MWRRNLLRQLERDNFAHICLTLPSKMKPRGSKGTYQITKDLFCVTLRIQESSQKRGMYLPHFDQKLQCRNMFVIRNRKKKSRLPLNHFSPLEGSYEQACYGLKYVSLKCIY